MPVRPTESQDEEDARAWVWPHGDGTRLPRHITGADINARRGSSRFVRQFRYWQSSDRSDQSPSDPAHLCDDDEEEDMEDLPPREDPAEMEVDMAEARPIEQSSVLREGNVFRGTQKVSRANKSEDWGVVITIHELNLQRGSCSGDMMAIDVPLATGPIVTHWEGEIIDGLNHSFVTCKWGASYSIDLAHWRKFSGFGPLNRKVVQAYGRCRTLHEFPYIFMRWKESFFVNPHDEGCSLTIAGFYYVCLSRETGSIEGYYFDPNSTPYQKLDLEMQLPKFTFSSYAYA